MHYCFITGFLRSGTTLLEKLVHALPGACIGPQPFPFLYYDTKRAFLRARGAGEERYPLGSLFREERYRPEDFHAFLRSHRLTPEATAASFAAMRGYNGWKLPALAEHAQVGDVLCGRVEHLVLQLSTTELRADQVPQQPQEPDAVARRQRRGPEVALDVLGRLG